MSEFTREEYEAAKSAIELRDLLIEIWQEFHAEWLVDGDEKERYSLLRLRLAQLEELDGAREKYDTYHSALRNADVEIDHIIMKRPYLDDYFIYSLLDAPTLVHDRSGNFIFAEFEPLLLKLHAYDLPADPPEAELRVDSSDWTGNRSVVELARAVQRLVPVAQQALEMIIQNEELRLHNCPPEPLEFEALQDLRIFHGELGELLRAAEAGESLGRQLKAIAIRAERIFHVKRGLDVSLRGIAAAGLSLVPTYCTVWALETIFRVALDSPERAALAAAAMGGSYYFLGPARDAGE